MHSATLATVAHPISAIVHTSTKKVHTMAEDVNSAMLSQSTGRVS
jgi:hypothetical protein